MPRKPQTPLTRKDVDAAKFEGFFMGVNTLAELILGKKPAGQVPRPQQTKPVGSKNRRTDRASVPVVIGKKAA